MVRELEPYHWSTVAANFKHITPACRLKQALSKAVQSFLKELDNYTLKPIWLKRINRFINYYCGVKYFIRDDNGGTLTSQDPFQNAKQKNTRILSRAEFILEHLTKRGKPASREELAVEN